MKQLENRPRSRRRPHALIGSLAALASLSALWVAGCGEPAAGRSWVHKLTLNGVHHVDRSDLQSKLAVEETSWVPFSPKRYLDPFTLEIDRKRIEAYFQLHGFYRAEVTALDVKQRDSASVDVTITIAEGPATKIDQLLVSGLEGVEKVRAKVLEGFDLKKGQIFDDEHFLARSNDVLARLKALGFAWAKVDAAAEVDRDGNSANLKVKVVPGPEVFIAKISSDGNFTDARRLQIHSGLLPGDRLTPDGIEAARGKLYNLGVFASVKVDFAPIPGRPGEADVTFHVQEGPLRELRLGGGFGLEFQRTEVRLRGIYTRRNFFGGLRTLRLTLEPAWVAIPAFWNLQKQGPAVKAEVQFTQPDLLFPLDQLKLTAGYDIGIDYAYQYHGPSTQIAYSRPFFHDKLHLSVSYNLQFLLFFNTDPAILANPDLAHGLLGFTNPYRLAWLQEDAVLDLRDQPLDPHKGVYLAVSGEEGNPYTGSAFQYEKLLLEGRGYIPLGSRVVLAARAQFGHMFVQGALGSPVTRRFFLGGPDSHRGFGYDRLSIQVPSALPNTAALPIGGDEMFLGQSEVRVSVAQIFGYWLEIATFLDAGDVAAPSCQTASASQTACSGLTGAASTRINFSNLHYATGAGLRYKTVIGTIRADLGIRLNRLAAFESDGTPNPDPGDRVAFHISIGEPF